MSIGGGSNKSKTTSTSASESEDYGAAVWGAQAPYLQDLYAKGNNMSSWGAGPQANAFLDLGGQNLQTGNNQYNLSGDILGASNNQLAQFSGSGVDPAVNAYAQNLGQNFREQFLPALKGDAALAGGLGGSRQQIGAALGAQRGMQTLGDFSAQAYAGQQERALGAAQALGDNARALTANAAGISGNSQNYAALADLSRSMPWYGLNQYAGLLGMPVSLDQGGWTSSTSTASGKSGGWNASFGLG